MVNKKWATSDRIVYEDVKNTSRLNREQIVGNNEQTRAHTKQTQQTINNVLQHTVTKSEHNYDEGVAYRPHANPETAPPLVKRQTRMPSAGRR